jgi:hypothetical protein
MHRVQALAQPFRNTREQNATFMPSRVSYGNLIYSALVTPEGSQKALDCWFNTTTQGPGSMCVSAKRPPSNDGEHNFGFLSSDDDAGLTDGGDTGPRREPFETFTAPAAAPECDAEQPAAPNTPQDSVDAPVTPLETGTHRPTNTSSAPDITEISGPCTDHVSRRLFVGLAGYTIALTLLLLGLLFTGRVSLFGNHTLESLPDLRPLAPNEFRKVPDGAELPPGHVLRLGESRRFGDVKVTPLRVTKEPLQFEGFLSKVLEEELTTEPVLKLWLTFENVADDYAFPPFDAGLMSHRTPTDSKDVETIANTFLAIGIPSGDSATTRRLNFLHSMDNNFVIVGQESARILLPGESLMTFVASSNAEGDFSVEEHTLFVWRVQFRKGVNVSSGNGVTTLIDVKFSGADIPAAG